MSHFSQNPTATQLDSNNEQRQTNVTKRYHHRGRLHMPISSLSEARARLHVKPIFVSNITKSIQM